MRIDFEEMHKGLSDQAIRDFLSQRYSSTSTTSAKSIAFLEQEISRLQQELVRAKEHAAIRLLIQKQGWKAIDASEYVRGNDITLTESEFIGTEQEYNILLQKLQGK